MSSDGDNGKLSSTIKLVIEKRNAIIDSYLENNRRTLFFVTDFRYVTKGHARFSV